MKMLFLMDPLEGVNPLKDTTYALMIGAARRGHETFYLPKDGISLHLGALVFDVEAVTATPDGEALFERQGAERLKGSEVDVVFIRTDPPFDAGYLHHTWLLDHAPDNLFVINNPSAVRTVNEKIWALQFTDLVPPSLVTQSIAEATAFLAEQGKIVAKPTDGFGGKGVFIVGQGDTNAGVVFETLTDDGKQAMIAQAYVPEAKVGDKRILLLNGEPLGAVLRVHSKEDHRNNFFAGGKAVATEITDHERAMIEVLRPHLVRMGLYFVGIDVIGDYLIEVNVTSPTCLQEMNSLYTVRLEDRVLDFVEDRVKEQRGNASSNKDTTRA